MGGDNFALTPTRMCELPFAALVTQVYGGRCYWLSQSHTIQSWQCKIKSALQMDKASVDSSIAMYCMNTIQNLQELMNGECIHFAPAEAVRSMHHKHLSSGVAALESQTSGWALKSAIEVVE